MVHSTTLDASTVQLLPHPACARAAMNSAIASCLPASRVSVVLWIASAICISSPAVARVPVTALLFARGGANIPLHAIASAEHKVSGHAVHPVVPAIRLYFPGTHAVHDPWSGPEYPASQTQRSNVVAFKSDDECVGHARQVLAPYSALYVSRGQSTHTLGDDAPTTVEYWPAEQLLHSACPGATLYLPATHCVQFAYPNEILCLPGTHCVHGPPTGPE